MTSVTDYFHDGHSVAKATWQFSKFLLLCSAENLKGFGASQGRVNDDRIHIILGELSLQSIISQNCKCEFEFVCSLCKFHITDSPDVAEVQILLVKITSHFPFRSNDCCQIDFWYHCNISVTENADVSNSS